MKINIVFIKSRDGFGKKEQERIRKIIKNTANHAAKVLNLKKNYIINFTIYLFKSRFTSGVTNSNDWIHLNVSKRFKENNLKGIVYHEMHHLGRDYTILGKKKFSLLDTLFTEGLAVVFEMEQVPNYMPWYSKYTSSSIKKWLPQVKEEKWDVDFSYDEWFFGAKGKPLRLGYKIGTYLVQQIKKHHPTLTAEKLIKRNVRELQRLSKVKL